MSPVETWDARFLTPAQAQAAGQLIAQVWPKPGVTAADRAEQLLAVGRGYSGSEAEAPRLFVVDSGGRLTAMAAILPRRVRFDGGEMVVAGLARVATNPAERGHGLGALVVRAALVMVDSGVFPFTLFQTDEQVAPFYEKFGAVRATNRFVNSLAADPEANPFWSGVVMRYPGGGDWPTGTIDLVGPGY